MTTKRPSIDKNEIQRLLGSLIKISSPNPPGYTDEIAELVANYFERAGLRVELVRRVKKKPNVVATIDGKGNAQTLLFNAHMDTVPIGNPRGWTVDPFGGETKNGRIYGRGSSDCKAGIAAMLLTAKGVMESSKKSEGTVAFHIVCDEETGGQNGTKYLVERGYADAADAVVSCEPCFNYSDGIHLDIAAKGLVWLEISAYGKAAHAKAPHLGINAIEKMAKIILAVQNMKLPNIKNRYLGSPTINVGMVKGGAGVNIIPDFCSVQVDRRILPQENPQEVIDQIRLVVEDLKKDDRELRTDCKTLKIWPSSKTDESEQIVELVKRIYERTTGQAPTISGKNGATDMWLYKGRGIPFLHCGPGVAANSHITDEFAEVQPIRDAIRLYTEVAWEFAGCAS